MLRRFRFGALALLGFTSLIDTVACGSDGGSSGSPAGTGGVGGIPVSGTGGTPATGTGGAQVSGAGGGVTPGAGGSFVGGNGGTTTLGNGGSGNVVGSGGAASTGGATSVGGAASTGGTASTGGAASTGGTASTGGAANTGGAAGGGSTSVPPCLSAGNQGAIIGDSYVTGALSPAMQPALGMLDPTVNSFRNYAVAGTSLATGGVLGLIPPQLTSALGAGMTKAMIMDGGGNDILICDASMFPNCATVCTSAGAATNATCKSIVQKATDAAVTLMNTAANGGVHDVIYFFYPHIPDAGGGGAGFAEILDYSEPLAKQTCDGANARTNGKLTCHFVDLVEPFKAAGGDKNPANFASDGIHPSQAGQNIIAKELFAVMKANCIGMTSADAMKNSCTCAM
ncbi:MAG TPA: SGNH/GDSL hydrolase family protein [Polyangiaceae bacterium]|nr:SGNH/GDSL hydrolase family protein [Polyangiaceae bacterium]